MDAISQAALAWDRFSPRIVVLLLTIIFILSSLHIHVWIDWLLAYTQKRKLFLGGLEQVELMPISPVL